MNVITVVAVGLWFLLLLWAYLPLYLWLLVTWGQFKVQIGYLHFNKALHMCSLSF